MRVIGLAGWSGAGKTTLLLKLIPELARCGVTVSTVKHAHHGFEVDRPGKDSHAHREAGASEVLVASSGRWVLMRELRGAPEPRLAEHLARLSPVDLVIVEGFKAEAHPKIAVHRAANGKPLIVPELDSVRAVASDEALPGLDMPVIRLDDVTAIASACLDHAEPHDALMARLAATPLRPRLKPMRQA
ncbi:MAG TPA: molybdopterin-guanine dinucleotide biosynthesis protein B [Beijerinckiaceae bacterium]|jgi:molybdopterin-guanine dinucleotide biosynthesis protein B